MLSPRPSNIATKEKYRKTRWANFPKFGWFASFIWMMKDRLELIRAHNKDLEEEGFDPVVCHSTREIGEHWPKDDSLLSIARYVYTALLGPSYARPSDAVLTALEDSYLNGSKLFVRPTDWLPGGIFTAPKVFPFEQITLPADQRPPGPVAFHAILYERLPPDEAHDIRMLRHRFVVLRDILNQVLTIEPMLRNSVLDEPVFLGWHNHYRQLVSLKPIPNSRAVHNFHVNDDSARDGNNLRSHFEASLLALLLLVGEGYAPIMPRSEREVEERYADHILSVKDRQALGKYVGQCFREEWRAPTVRDIRIDARSPTTTSDSSTRARGSLADLNGLDCLRLCQTASDLVEQSQRYAYPAILRAIEDGFLERQYVCNVQIRSAPDNKANAEGMLTVTRLEFEALSTPARKTLERNPPHLIRYHISYPPQWDLEGSCNDRLKFFKWLGLIDLVERRHPPEFGDAGPTIKNLYEYDPAERKRANSYAIALDALAGDPRESECLTLAQVERILTDEDDLWHQVMALPYIQQTLLDSMQLLLPDNAREHLRDCRVAQVERAWILRKLLQDGMHIREEWLTTLVAKELDGEGDLEPAWRDALLSAAEELDFRKDDDRARVVDGLFKLAIRLRDNQGHDAAQVLWSAIRSYASLVPVARARTLSEFLRVEDSLKTKQVALQGIQNVFRMGPPPAGTTTKSLDLAVDRILEKYLLADSEYLSGAEAAALVTNAIHAAAVLGNARLVEFVRRIATLDNRLFIRRIRDEILKRILDEWPSSIDKSRPTAIAEALKTIHAAMAELGHRP